MTDQATSEETIGAETPHRHQPVETIDGIEFIDDSMACDPAASLRTLQRHETIYWIAGGSLIAGGYEPLTPALPRVRHAALIGEAAPAMAEWLTANDIPHTVDETLERAVKHLAVLAKDDDLDGAVVLLSPASPPQDPTPTTDARGELFRTAVRALEVEAAG